MPLAERDEGLHAPPAAGPARWQENMFFICWDTGTRSGFVCHVRRAPGTGKQEAQAVVVIDGQMASAWLEGPFVETSLVPELDAVALEPFRQWSLRLDCTGVAGAGPLGFVAARPGGDTPLGVDLTLDAVLPAVDFAEGLAQVVAGMRENSSGPQMGDQHHYEQGGTWHGRLRIGAREVEATGLFVRDHSWGVRDEHGDFKAFWTASCLDGGNVFCNAIGIPTGDRVVGIGAVADASGVRFTTDVAATFQPAAGVCTYDRTAVHYGAPLDRTLVAETQLHVPLYLPHSGAGRYDNNALSAVRMDGAAGFGVMEWAAVLTDEQLAVLGVGETVS